MDNPFVASHMDAWSSGELLDLASLNASASDAIVAAIKRLQRDDIVRRLTVPVETLLLLGPAGSGKTHLFERVRRVIGPRAVLVHLRPDTVAGPSMRAVLAAIVDALRRPVTNVPYCQADLFVGTLLAAADDDGATHMPFAALERHRATFATARETLTERVLAWAEQQAPGAIFADYLERLVCVPFAEGAERRALLSWLSGREPSPGDLMRVAQGGRLEDLSVLPALATLGFVGCCSAPLVLAFDQLEHLVDGTGALARIQGHAQLVSEIITLKGMVVVQMALDQEWDGRISPALTQAQKTRLAMHKLTLALPSRDERRDLIALWVTHLLGGRNPFSQAQIDAWCSAPGMTPRMLMAECGEANLVAHIHTEAPPLVAALPSEDAPMPSDVPVAASLEPPSQSLRQLGVDEALSASFGECIARSRQTIDEAAAAERGVEATQVLGGIKQGLELLCGTPTAPRSIHSSPALSLHLAGDDVLIVAMQQTHPASLKAVLGAVAAAKDASVWIVREAACAIRPTWRAVNAALGRVLAERPTRLLELSRDDVAHLLAFEEFCGAARSQDLTAADGSPISREEALAWAATSLPWREWSPFDELLAWGARRTAGPPSEAPPGEPAVAPAPSAVPAVAMRMLARLRVASLDRLLREVRKEDPAATTESIKRALSAEHVRFFGSSIVGLRGQRTGS